MSLNKDPTAILILKISKMYISEEQRMELLVLNLKSDLVVSTGSADFKHLNLTADRMVNTNWRQLS